MVNTEKLAAYYKSAQDEKEAAEESAKTGKPVSQILADKAKKAKEKEIADYDAEVKRQTAEAETASKKK